MRCIPWWPIKACSLALLLLAAQGCTCTEMQTTHYVGVFDPQQQVTQELYRITINGHSKPMSSVKYASGWVPARTADLLTRAIRYREHDIELSGADPADVAAIEAERRFFEIGPLGVSFEPQDARFVVVMNSDPDYFFQKMSIALDALSGTASDPTRRQREQVRKTIVDERTKATEALLNLLKTEDK